MPFRICLVSPGHLASNPRLVKEAEALENAGYCVQVVAGDTLKAIRVLDDSVTASASWRVTKVNRGGFLARRWRSLRRHICRWLLERKLAPSVKVALWAESDLIDQLESATAQEPADLYIGHYLPGLAAAAYAARRHNAALGFDAEDSHVDELPDERIYQRQRGGREWIERTYLPRCRHLTASSPGTGAAMRRRYGVESEIVLNVFPLSDAPANPQATSFLNGAGLPSLYWFSQTIGPGRGLEPVITAMSKMKVPVRLSLRGLLAAGYGETLRRQIEELGLSGKIEFSEQAPPEQMAKLAAPHDLGLAVELCEPPNRSTALTNKIFTYLLAGVPVLLSRTPAQESISQDLGPAAILADLEDTGSLAASLDSYFSNENRQQLARAHAWKLGQTKYNWDLEKEVFLRSVRRALGEEST